MGVQEYMVAKQVGTSSIRGSALGCCLLVLGVSFGSMCRPWAQVLCGAAERSLHRLMNAVVQLSDQDGRTASASCRWRLEIIWY